MTRNVKIVSHYGEMWARNTENIKRVPSSKLPGGIGVYILFDGSMPVYIGKGNIKSRLKRARKSSRRKEFWDRFSWFGLADSGFMHDVEDLLLNAFPRNLRSLTGQGGNFIKANPIRQKDKIADAIKRT